MSGISNRLLTIFPPPYIKGEMSGNVRLVSVLRARQVSAPLARWSFAAAGPLLVVPALRTGMLRNEKILWGKNPTYPHAVQVTAPNRRGEFQIP
jgi:hypothetical protein